MSDFAAVDVDENYNVQWVKRATGQEMSELGKRVAMLMGAFWQGIYHDGNMVRRTDWTNSQHIQLTICWRSLSTFDGAELTRLVFLAHDYALRVEMRAAAPNVLQLLFHQRARKEGDMSLWEYHPTLEDAVASWRMTHPAEEVYA